MKVLLTLLAFALLGAGAPASAQSESKKPASIALKGNDPVSYFNPGTPAKGTSKLNFDFDDSRYYFSTPKNRELFAANPDRYAPQFTGLCATGLSMGMKAEADPGMFLVKDGKLYVFSSVEAREMAQKDSALLGRAHEAWRQSK